jgi:hypothetical protein
MSSAVLVAARSISSLARQKKSDIHLRCRIRRCHGGDRQERGGMNIRRLTWLCLSVLSAMLISPALPQQATRGTCHRQQQLSGR